MNLFNRDEQHPRRTIEVEIHYTLTLEQQDLAPLLLYGEKKYNFGLLPSKETIRLIATNEGLDKLEKLLKKPICHSLNPLDDPS